jgi:hypothetical protein
LSSCAKFVQVKVLAQRRGDPHPELRVRKQLHSRT